jgi:dTDP-4-dehydrorhamnose 3,5-epimerase
VIVLIRKTRTIQTYIEGLIIIEPSIYQREDIVVVETYDEKDMREIGLNTKFVQENQSVSKKGVLRGLHLQKKFSQEKIIRVADGKIYDVAVDARIGSATYGKWLGIELSSKNHRQLYIPKGFAHGFYVMSDVATVCFKVSDYWYKDDEIGIPWDDPVLNIDWPIEEDKELLIANKDLHYDPFLDLEEKLRI